LFEDCYTIIGMYGSFVDGMLALNLLQSLQPSQPTVSSK
jgi:hypothetical protein